MSMSYLNNNLNRHPFHHLIALRFSLLLLLLLKAASVQAIFKQHGGGGVVGGGAHNYNNNNNNNNNGDLHLWIDGEQVKKFGGYSVGSIAVIDDGQVQADILDPNFEKYLPTIPSEVTQVNFTWMSGKKKYYYDFHILRTLDNSVLDSPKISIKTHGKIPRKSRVFSVILPCTGNRSGVAPFEVGLMINTKQGKPLDGTPIRLKLRKECTPKGLLSTGPDPECDKSCAHGGRCNQDRVCVCAEGYMGQYCTNALCYPQCMHGGNCTSPGVCSCPLGYQGRHCEGGICSEACQNGGKCVQKDKCECPRGYYGLHCEFSKCLVPCLNGGRCKGINKCRCPSGYHGDHCEVKQRVPQRSACRKPCRHGTCQPNQTCLCDSGWSGKLCQHKMILPIRRINGV